MFAYPMRNLSIPKRFGGRIAAIVIVAALFPTATAGAAGPPESFSDSVTFIGDSVTAGFGYCGTENPNEVTCNPNEEMEDAWKEGEKSSLEACAPKHSPKAPPSDTCSNDNYNGKPWKQGPWKPGKDAPDVAYPFQLAKDQSPTKPASVSDWAVSGATPTEWDPSSPLLGKLLPSLKSQYVGMTLGANPLLSDFVDIGIAGFGEVGSCVKSTGYKEWVLGRWYAGPLKKPVECLHKRWKELKQTEHLVRIYDALLGQGDRVVVLGYYRDCNWSFGNWQPEPNPLSGPSKGYSCKSQKRPVSPSQPKEITQWEQAIAVGSALDTMVRNAVLKAKQAAKKKWPGTDRADNIIFTKPDDGAWENHQATAADTWVFRNDTWIHPSRAGAANLAQTVAQAMCASFGHWCVSNGELSWE